MPWWRNPRWWAVIVTGLAVIVTIIIWQWPREKPDFLISNDPLSGQTEPGGNQQTLVKVKKLGGYKESVTLSANGQPHGVVVTFFPVGGPEPPYYSTMTIAVDSNVATGKHTITIIGRGADGTEHTCKYDLTVVRLPTPDFSISINPAQGEVEQGNIIETTVNIKGVQEYEHPVSLSATGQLSDMLIAFTPLTEVPSPSCDSTMKINVGSDIPDGDYTITVTGTGSDGTVHSTEYCLTVYSSKLPPTAVVSVTTTVIEEGERVSLRGMDSTDPDGTIVTYTWDFGDDKTATGASVTHIYATSGNYTVTLAVVDNDGLSDTATVEIIVSRPLDIRITSPESGDRVPISTTVRGTISGDLPEGQHMWVAINPHTSPGKWWPQARRIEPLKGQWYVEVWLGRETEDVGIEFDIAVILVNEEDDQAYIDYLTRGKETGGYPGIPLPPSANLMDSVTVIRK